MLYRFLFAAILILPAQLFAWTEHSMLTYRALSVMPRISKAAPVKSESLEDFLLAEQKGIADVLRKQEAWARVNVPVYPPRPDSLEFKAGEQGEIVKRFLHAIRVNPDIKLLQFIQLAPDQTLGGRKPITHKEISVFKKAPWLKESFFYELTPGERISPLAVIATASDEPDFGLDMGLFSDNKTEYGAIYGFGKQAIGDMRFVFSSQAPFHMGFYHEGTVVYTLAGFLKRTYPEYRIHQFRALARYAFKTGHDYWGYRFLGWGVHYVGDLTQPYHAKSLPGISLWAKLWFNFKHVLGFGESQQYAIQLVNNRHMAVERFQQKITQLAFRDNGKYPALMQALINTKLDAAYGPFDDAYTRNVLARESNENADKVNAAIAKNFPARFVKDPTFGFSAQPTHLTVYDEVQAKNPEKLPVMIETIVGLFGPLGAHSRNYVRSGLVK